MCGIMPIDVAPHFALIPSDVEGRTVVLQEGNPTMTRSHRYAVAIAWTGNQGTGTSDYRSYGRDQMINAEGKPAIAASSNSRFRSTPPPTEMPHRQFRELSDRT
jgi:hypothetical protein